MTEQVSLSAEERKKYGKSANKTLRKEGIIPGVVYGGKEDPKKISILEKEITKASEVVGFTTQILKISLGNKNMDVVVKEIQRHPSTSRVLHADFMRVDPDTRITLIVPIRTINDNTCVGVKVSGGQINHLINDVEISCLASNLPESLEVDVKEMDIGDSVLLSEIFLPEGVEITTLTQGEDRDQSVVSVTEAREIIIEEEVEETEEGEEGLEEDALEDEEGEAKEEKEGEDSSDGKDESSDKKKE